MNTIPIIFNQRAVNRTVLGGSEKNDSVSMPVTCVILNRSGNQYRNFIFEKILSHGFKSVICVESNDRSRNLDELSHQYPSVRFVIPHEAVTPGDMINLGMAEAEDDYVLVVQDDMCTEAFRFPSQLSEKLIMMNQFCICPRLVTNTQQLIPIRFIPTVKNAVFSLDVSSSMASGNRTFYACDWAGFYNREKFMQLGGADYTIKSPYWQKLDLFMRSWLWGESTVIDTGLTFTYSGNLPEENTTTDKSYLLFYLKNLLPVYRNGKADIPLSSFISFKKSNRCGLRESINLFRAAGRWTDQNKYRFKMDAVRLIEGWAAVED